MKQNAEQTDTAAPGDLDVEDFRYHRIGYVDQGRKADRLLATFLGLLPGDGNLPLRWHYRSNESFLKRNAHLGAILWAASNNSHLLMVNGFHALRIWHDTSKTCYVDVADNVCANLPASMLKSVEPVPENNWKKSKPLTKRIQVWQQWQMQELHQAVKRTYGLHSS